MEFKIWLESEEMKIKGAFREFPKELQPIRIPVDSYQKLKEKVESLLSPLGRIFIPDVSNKSQKTTTGDLDVIFDPYERNRWRDDVLAIMPNVITKISNGPQLMMVVKGLIDDNQYMIDVILTNNFEFSKVYFAYGSIIPAIVGSFARSLGYKYGNEGLFARIKDSRGNFRNIKLTDDPTLSFQILGLNPRELDQLKTPQGVADWITRSPRFDSNAWHVWSNDGTTIVTKNRHAQAAIRKDDMVKQTFQLIDQVDKKSTIQNPNFNIERKILGNEIVDNLLRIEEKIIRPQVLTGQEIMQILQITQGPEIGKWQKFLNNHPDFLKLPNDQLLLPQTKEKARQLLLNQQR